MAMTSIVQDLRRTLRSMKKEPGFAAVAVVTLALGIGANTAIFSVVDGALLEADAYPRNDPGRVVFLSETTPHWDEVSIAYPNYKDWQELNRCFTSIAGYRQTDYVMTGLDEAIRLEVTQVSHGYFGLLGVAAHRGRLFEPEDDRAGAPPVVVIDHALWRNRFGEDRQVVGRTIRLDDEPHTIIGVLPADFDLLPDERAFTSLERWADNEYALMRGNHQGIFALARLRGGVSLDEARTEMSALAAQLEAQYPDTNARIGAVVEPLRARRVETYASTLWALLGAVSLVLLIACANVANLLLARSVSRRREAAIQAALGATRRRLVQQGLMEGLSLALAGGTLGVVLAVGALEVLKRFLPGDLPRLERVDLDATVLAYGLAASLVTGLVFGGVPALLAARVRPADPLRQGGRSSRGGGGAGRALLVGEVALATLLLVGAGLLIRTVYALSAVDPGFRTDRLLTFQLSVPHSRFEGEARSVLFRTIRERLEALPGARSATLGLNLPMLGASWTSVFIVGDRPVPRRGELPTSLFTPVEENYFETLEIPLLRGRTFDERDREDAPRVAVVNEELASHFWPDEDPIGKRLKQGFPDNEGEANPWREIVGVVGSVKQFGLGSDTRMQTYLPAAQQGLYDVSVAVRTDVEPLTLVGAIEREIRAVDPGLPVYDLATMAGTLSDSVAPRRFTMILFGLFAALALALAAIGLYGVLAYANARRTAEIGLRMSIGANRRDIFELVVKQGMVWALLGAALGLSAAVAASRLLESFLFGVEARDPVTFTVVPLVLLTVALAATAIPAAAAARVDPIRALRYE